MDGIDPSPKLIGAARRHAAQTGREIGYTVGKSEQLPYADASFDIVTCVDVLEHVESPAQAVREIQRVLVPGGLFLFDTINRTMRSRGDDLAPGERDEDRSQGRPHLEGLHQAPGDARLSDQGRAHPGRPGPGHRHLRPAQGRQPDHPADQGPLLHLHGRRPAVTRQRPLPLPTTTPGER
ncbi:methyltransferase domain-containing protein [Streptacidiphilus sp. 4-A2]|nr:methyltransferase domain-containing protein [Streptacidiphilus sp. 4-A2]